jgi:hypothetical protein
MNKKDAFCLSFFCLGLNVHAAEYAGRLSKQEMAQAISAALPVEYLSQLAQRKFDWEAVEADCFHCLKTKKENRKEAKAIIHKMVVIPTGEIIEKYLNIPVGNNGLTLRQLILDQRELFL